MIEILGHSYHYKLALALGLLALPTAAFAQNSLPTPGLGDQLTAQQSPLAPEIQAQMQQQQAQPVPQASAEPAVAAPSQTQLGMQQTTPPSATSGAAALDEMRARAQAARGVSGTQTASPQTAQTQGANMAPSDALPQVRDVKVKTEGMDYMAQPTVNVQMRDTPLDSGGNNSEQQQESIRQEAFDSAATGMFPLRTDEIKEILRRYDETRKAVETPHYDLPKPEVKVETLSLDPGVTPPVINTAVGHVTTLTMLDVTGAPWPIQDVSWAGDFEVVEPEEGGHIIRITPMKNFAYGNISMRLLTLKTPITMTLQTSRDTVEYRFDARIPEYGPMAEAPLIEGSKQIVAGDKVMTQILDGVTPENAERLDVSGVDGRTTALLVGSTTYLRTPLTLLSPAWDNSVKSADGMNVYAMAETPVVLLSDAGKFRRATLRPREGLSDE